MSMFKKSGNWDVDNSGELVATFEKADGENMVYCVESLRTQISKMPEGSNDRGVFQNMFDACPEHS